MEVALQAREVRGEWPFSKGADVEEDGGGGPLRGGAQQVPAPLQLLQQERETQAGDAAVEAVPSPWGAPWVGGLCAPFLPMGCTRNFTRAGGWWFVDGKLSLLGHFLKV